MNLTPIINTSNLTFNWNVDEINAVLTAQLEKYQDLIVTEDNYDDMQKARREVVKFRTTITNFGKEAKRELKRPVDQFTSELNEVLLTVSRVEEPLAKQLEYFEQKLLDEKKEKINVFIEESSQTHQVRDEYVTMLQHDARWLNKSYKLNEIKADIDTAMKELLKRQQAEDDYKKIQSEKRGMIEFVVDTCNAQYELATPITFDQVWLKVKDVPLDQAREMISAMFEERHALEEQVKSTIVETKPIVHEIEPVVYEQEPSKYVITLYNVTQGEIDSITNFIKVHGVEFTGEMK